MHTIYPYYEDGIWMFDDDDKGLKREALVAGIPEIIDAVCLSKGISRYKADGIVVRFSGEEIQDADAILDHVCEEIPTAIPEFGLMTQGAVVAGAGEVVGNTYSLRGSDMKGWLCPALYKYFDKAPETMYIRVEAKSE